ncbi:hypothetical protein OsccyDRAFT_2775 [Leptolyngbyaceae cyanobacterium JSC-12]|nr:hypothetical protein OsccyDRAFT_2775 [Leptolyngbyaceae cyanobacterium JSC-12]
MMRLLIWVVFAWFAGAAAILGSLMTLGSLLLWLIPVRGKTPESDQRLAASHTWRTRIRLLLFSLALAMVGFSILSLVPLSNN